MNVKKNTVVRTACLVLALINNILTMIGKNPLPFSDEEMYSGISAIVTAAVSVWTWWENNSFTSEAIIADEIFSRLKEEKKQALAEEKMSKESVLDEEEDKDDV